MAIDTRCPSCSKLLRVGDEYAGRRARCPACGQIYDVQSETKGNFAQPILANVQSTAIPSAGARWYMRTPENATFGPVSREELDQWFFEGRIGRDCYLSEGEGGYWQPAFAIYSFPPSPSIPSSPNAASAYASPAYYSPTNSHQANWHTAHRGGLILALAILGWMFCPIFSIFAWAMGSSDLREMRAGRMDSSGMALTQAGQILGMIQVVLCLLGLAFAVFVILVDGIGRG